jgi:hypothetical protein
MNVKHCYGVGLASDRLLVELSMPGLRRFAGLDMDETSLVTN